MIAGVGAVAEAGHALFLSTAILTFVGAFLLLMSARLAERVIEYHLA